MLFLPVSVATTDGMSTRKRYNFPVIETHTVENLFKRYGQIRRENGKM